MTDCSSPSSPDELFESQAIPAKSISINKEYAKSFEEHKKNKEVKKLQAKYGASYKDGSDSESAEDEFAELYTDAQEDAFANLLWNIRNQTAEIQDEKTSWWPEDSVDTDKRTKGAPTETLKTQLTHTVLHGASDEVHEEPSAKPGVNTHKRKMFIADADQGGLSKTSFLNTIDTLSEPAEDILVAVGTVQAEDSATARPPTESGQIPRRKKSRAFQEVFSRHSADASEETEFLKTYFRQQGWKNSIVDESGAFTGEGDAEEEIKEENTPEEASEAKPEAPAEIDSMRPHPRSAQIDSLRERTTARNEVRKAKQEKQAEQKRLQQEEIDRLETLQKEGLNRRINVISKVSGSKKIKEIISDKFLSSDFDEKEWDKQMARLFSDDFYDGEGKDEEDDEFQDDDAWMFAGAPENQSGTPEIDPRLQGELHKLQTEIKQIHKDRSEHQTQSRHKFRYATVPTDDIALSTEDIIQMDDRKLNEIAPLRWYAPYVTDKERRKFKYMSLAKKKDVRGRGSESSGFRKSQKYRQNSGNVE